MNLEQAKKACKNGAYAAFIRAGIVIFQIFSSAQSVTSGNPTPWERLAAEPVNYISVVLLLMCGAGLLKYSKTASITLLVLFIYGAFAKFILMGVVKGFVADLIFLYFFGKAAQGTFAYHRLKLQAEPVSIDVPNFRDKLRAHRTPLWKYYLGVPAALIFFGLAALGVLSELNIIPSLEVLPGDKIRSSDKELLREKGILMENERIDWFYSEGLFSIMAGGNILTDKRVISYETVDKELNIYSLNVEDITEIYLNEKGGSFNDTVITAYNKEGDWARLYLSNENKGDKKFIDELLKRTQLKLLDPPPDETPAEESSASAEI